MDSPNNFMGSEAFLKWTLDCIVDCRGNPDTLTSLDSVYWLCVEGMLDVVSFSRLKPVAHSSYGSRLSSFT